MATVLAKRTAALRTRLRPTRRSSMTASRIVTSNTQEIHLRIADIEGALDIVRARVRLAAPAFGAGLVGRQRAAGDRFFGDFHLVPSTKKRGVTSAQPSPKRRGRLK